MKNIYIILIVIGSIGIMAFTHDIDRNNTIVNEVDKDEIYDSSVVLELFTSQGCSSCPSADQLLQKVKKENQEEVFALSYHVDYWNYIGWKDPFSKAEYAKKQRIYNTKFRNRTNYTPQIVVNGETHFVGSNAAEMYSKINLYGKKKSANEIDLSNVGVHENQVSFRYKIEGSLEDKILRTVLVIDERVTKVKRGENKNRTLENSNIVIAEQSFLLEETQDAMKISIPEIVETDDKLNLIVLVETKDYDITAAAKQSLVRDL
jgi:hypothetical protein